jgi:hypothetical protein
MHMSDNLEDWNEPWAPCSTGWCVGLDHMSCSIVNAHCGQLFWNRDASARWGFVLSSDTTLECTFSADGGTQGQPLGGCHTKPLCNLAQSWACAWPPEQTASMLGAQNCGAYNEVIVSADVWREALPTTIEAVVFADEAARGRARQVHRAFLQHFSRTALETPLLQLSWGESQPFRDASGDPETRK